MTLKDKFDNPIMRHDLGRNEIEETKEQCVEIANEFAIDFAEWCQYRCVQKEDLKSQLEIYKKVKGL